MKLVCTVFPIKKIVNGFDWLVGSRLEQTIPLLNWGTSKLEDWTSMARDHGDKDIRVCSYTQLVKCPIKSVGPISFHCVMTVH